MSNLENILKSLHNYKSLLDSYLGCQKLYMVADTHWQLTCQPNFEDLQQAVYIIYNRYLRGYFVLKKIFAVLYFSICTLLFSLNFLISIVFTYYFHSFLYNNVTFLLNNALISKWMKDVSQQILVNWILTLLSNAIWAQIVIRSKLNLDLDTSQLPTFYNWRLNFSLWEREFRNSTLWF